MANGYCAQPNENTPSLWYNQVQDLVTYLHDNTSFGTSSMLYFEIGNEPDFQQTGDKRSGQVGLYTDGTSFTSTDGSYHYEDVFAYAARGLQQALSSKGYTRYRILTAGMFIPSANINKGACQSTKAGDAGNNNSQDVFAAGLGIAEAEASYPAGYVPPPGVPMYSGPAVPATHLGLGVHPYGYNSSGGYWWRNEYRKTDALGRRIRPGTSCSNIDILTRTWSGTGKDYAPPTSRYSGKTYDFLQHGSVGSLPLVFTEDNYSTGERAAAGPIDPKTNKPTVIAVNNAQAEGAYIADLFTWVYNHVCGRSKGQCNRSIGIDPGKSRLRVGIWRGVNKGDDKLGMYYSGSEVPPTNPLTDVYYRKYANLSVCPQARNIASGGQSIPHIYASLINAACYH